MRNNIWNAGFTPQIEVNEDTVERKEEHAYLLKDGEIVRFVMKMGEKEQVMIIRKVFILVSRLLRFIN